MRGAVAESQGRGLDEVSGVFLRIVLGAATAAWALDAAAQDRSRVNDVPYGAPPDYSSERAAPPAPSDSYDSYVADPSESYVTEGSDVSDPQPPMTPPIAPPNARVAAAEPQRPAPACREYYPVGADRSGTMCEQSDGSLRIVTAPTNDAPRSSYAALPSQYCREYQQTVMADGYPRTAYGKACWQRDGSWHVVTAPAFATGDDRERGIPASAAPYYPQDYPQAPRRNAPAPVQLERRASVESYQQRTAPVPSRSYTTRPTESRLKLPEFYFGNLFGWLHPAKPAPKRRYRDRYDD